MKLTDYDLIVEKLPKTQEYIDLYPIGDVHIGSQECNYTLWKRYLKEIAENENAKVILLGDLMDNGLKNSKTDIYKSTLMPDEQLDVLINDLSPIKDKIIVGVEGNHERRSALDVGLSVSRMLYKELGLENRFAENMAFLKISLGEKNKERQYSYGLAVTHGKTRNKTKNFVPYIDGLDIFISGHTHEPESYFKEKIVIDLRNEIVRTMNYAGVVVPSFLEFGGYAMRDLYTPSTSGVMPVIRLFGTEKRFEIIWKQRGAYNE